MLGLGASVAIPAVLSGYENTHSLLLDGTDDYFDTNNTFQTLLRNCESTGFTFSTWINLDNTSGSQAIFGNQDSGSVVNGLIGFYFSGTALYFIIRGKHDDNSNKSYLAGVFTTAAADEWNMWSVTFTPGASDTDVGTFTIYKNGVAQSSTVILNTFTGQALSNIQFDNNLHIGNWNGLDYDLDGHMDQWAFWNDDLPASNLLALYQKPGHDYTVNLGNYQGAGKLDVYYKFDNNTDDAAETSNGSLANDAAFDTEVPS